MKINRLLALIAFTALFLSASAIVPKTENNNTSGSHLEKMETKNAPKLITMADIMKGDKTPSEKWTGLDPKKYADVSTKKMARLILRVT